MSSFQTLKALYYGLIAFNGTINGDIIMELVTTENHECYDLPHPLVSL